MSKNVALLLVLIFLTASCIIGFKTVSASSPNSWTSKAPMQVARSGLGVAVVNDKIYAIGGSTQQGSSPDDLSGGFVGTNEEYNPTTDTWTFKKPMPTPRHYFATAVYQNKIYCIDGYLSNGTVTGANEVYDPETDTWETKAPMPTPRTYITANVVNGKIYIIGGDSNGTLNEVYDPETDSWTTKVPMPTASYGYASAVVDNKIYIIDSNLNQIYDPETDTWSQGASPPSRVGYGKAGATTGVNAPKRIYVLSEMSGEPPYFNQVYDPEKDRWTFGADVPTTRRAFGVAVVNDMLYAIGGSTETFDTSWNSHITVYATNEHYTPFGYGTPAPSYDGTAPEIAVASPENRTYYTVDVALNFTVNEPVSLMRYELDGETVGEISGNTTLNGLSHGAHNVTIYAWDTAGNGGTSETITFTVAKPEPFPTTLVVAPIASVAVIGVGLLLYFKKRKR